MRHGGEVFKRMADMKRNGRRLGVFAVGGVRLLEQRAAADVDEPERVAGPPIEIVIMHVKTNLLVYGPVNDGMVMPFGQRESANALEILHRPGAGNTHRRRHGKPIYKVKRPMMADVHV